MTDKILFLDFDGVLHAGDAKPAEYFGRAQLLVGALEAVSIRPSIVISSSWRHHYQWRELVGFLPAELRPLAVDRTGEAFVGPHARYEEIRIWLAGRRLEWRALDDCAWEFPPGCPELIACDGASGITEREAMRVQNWLTGQGVSGCVTV